MKKIWKFRISTTYPQSTSLSMPVSARIVYVSRLDVDVCAWAEVETEQGQELREFVVVGTGYDIFDNWVYVGTAIFNRLVWHLYEVKQ